MGERPTHPALLRLSRGGVDARGLATQADSPANASQCRVSAIGKRQSHSRESSIPKTGLFARFNRQRVEAEVVRDSMLVSERRTRFHDVRQREHLDENMRRRSIYFTVKRSKLIPSLHVFDAPDALQGIGFRQTTTVAPQALMLLNNKIVREYAETFAKHLSNNRSFAKTSNLPSNAEFIEPAYLAALSRPPSKQEYADTLAFLNAQAETYRKAGKPDGDLPARTDFCQALFSLNEFLFVE